MVRCGLLDFRDHFSIVMIIRVCGREGECLSLRERWFRNGLSHQPFNGLLFLWGRFHQHIIVTRLKDQRARCRNRRARLNIENILDVINLRLVCWTLGSGRGRKTKDHNDQHCPMEQMPAFEHMNSPLCNQERNGVSPTLISARDVRVGYMLPLPPYFIYKNRSTESQKNCQHSAGIPWER